MPEIVAEGLKGGMREDSQLESGALGNGSGSVLRLEEREALQLWETTEGDGDDAQDLVDLLRFFRGDEVHSNCGESARKNSSV